MLMLLSMHVTSVLFLVRFNNSALAMGFYLTLVARSYALLMFYIFVWCMVFIVHVYSLLPRTYRVGNPCTSRSTLPWQLQMLALVTGVMTLEDILNLHPQSFTHDGSSGEPSLQCSGPTAPKILWMTVGYGSTPLLVLAEACSTCMV